MTTIVIHPAVEPGVIDNNMLIKCVLEQGPTGEAGRLFAEEGVHLDEVEILRLEFLNIIRIDHLWMLTSLTKLALTNNHIEVMENLESLTKLTELNLAFNSIKKIENLDTLVNIEVLMLNNNLIKTLENMENLEKLSVFSIAGNKIADYKEVVYLRQFRQLRTFSFKDNPASRDPDYLRFLKAALPRVMYINYALVSDEDREASVEEFRSLLNKLEEAEEIQEIARTKKEKYDNQNKLYALSFVEYLSGPEIFNRMFELDVDGNTLLKIGGDLLAAYEEYKIFFVETMQKLVDFGESQYTIRTREVEMFHEVIDRARTECYEKSKEIVEQYMTDREECFEMMGEIVDRLESKAVTMLEVHTTIAELRDQFTGLIKDIWDKLMGEELTLYEQCEETRLNFAENVRDLANKMIEATRAAFTLWRDREGMWSIRQGEILVLVLGKGLQFDSIPDLQELMSDRDVVMDALAQSTDSHMRFIDDREDHIITRVSKWLDDMINSANIDEINRNRSRVLEINYYVDNQKKEWEDLQVDIVNLEINNYSFDNLDI